MDRYPWLRDVYPFNPEEYDPEDIKSVPEVAMDDCHKTLTITNVSEDITNICYVTVFDVDLLDRNDNLLTSGISSTTMTTSTLNNPIVEKQRKCTTFIITIPPQTFIELCSLAPRQSTQQHGSSWSNVEIESDIQPITVHPYPNDIHLYTMHFPFQPIDSSNNDDNNNNPNSSCCGAFQCIQSEKGELTHFFKGNYHAIDFACPVGTPLYSPVNGIVVTICQHHGSNDNNSNNDDDGNGGSSTIIGVSGIAATNMYQWNSIMIQVADDDINDNDPLYVEFVHIQTNSCVVQVGDVVHKGQYICCSGSVGFSPVPHLHMSAYRSSDDDAATVRFRFECSSLPLAVSSNEEQEDKDDSIICKTEKAAIEEEDRVTRSFLPMAGGWYDCNGLRS
jgi:murein DD-endopeptidase MepM/ murein hydrolase activator NlpD